jgi:hypothetical protein
MRAFSDVRKTRRVVEKGIKVSLIKQIFGRLFTEDNKRRIVKNDVFEIPYDKDKTEIIYIPNIEKQVFKISKWFCKVGENIEKGTVICELKNKKITIEFKSFISGKLVKITNKTMSLKTGDEICKIEKN